MNCKPKIYSLICWPWFSFLLSLVLKRNFIYFAGWRYYERKFGEKINQSRQETKETNRKKSHKSRLWYSQCKKQQNISNIEKNDQEMLRMNYIIVNHYNVVCLLKT